MSEAFKVFDRFTDYSKQFEETYAKKVNLPSTK